MIRPIPPEVQDRVLLMATDQLNGSLTVHRSNGFVGLAISDMDGDTAAYQPSREDRAALIRVLIELQEDEGLS